MKLTDLDFDLPDEQIAQMPPAGRSTSRMLTVDRNDRVITDRVFTDITEMIGAGDVVVVNNTKVFPARLYGKSETGAAIEIFLAEEIGDNRWEVLARPARRLKAGKKVIFADDLTAVVVERTADGRVIVDLKADGDLFEIIDRIGTTPLPPYIKRDATAIDTDRERYQTVYASDRGAIAAPTAGLHFTPEILSEIKANGAEIIEITLHVGYGTFEPVRVDDISEHTVSTERYLVSNDAAERLNAAISSGKRIIAVGTTTTRALESQMTNYGRFEAGGHIADLTITPGYEFKAVSALVTNFHLPKSSLLILTATFGGHDLIMRAYKHAVGAGYRFYSYGDCMFII